MKNRHHVLQCLNSFVQHLIVDLKRIRIRILDRGGLPWLWNTEGIYRSKINACASLHKLIYPAIVIAAALNMCWMLPKNMMDQISIFAYIAAFRTAGVNAQEFREYEFYPIKRGTSKDRQVPERIGWHYPPSSAWVWNERWEGQLKFDNERITKSTSWFSSSWMIWR